MKVLSVINQKGGCGKTTTSVNLSYFLSQTGKKVLLVDMDPQAHSTLHFSIDSENVDRNIYDFLKYAGKEYFDINDVLIKIYDNLFLIPSHLVLSVFEQSFSGVEDHEYRLKYGLSYLPESFDYVIIDCPPNLGLLTFNALMASDAAIVPIEPSTFSMDGIVRLKDTIKLIEEKTGHSIIVRALVTLYDRRSKFSEFMLHRIHEEFGENVFNTLIRQTVRLKESAYYGKPIGLYNKKSSGYEDYKSLSNEVLGLFEENVAQDNQKVEIKAVDNENLIEYEFALKHPDARDIRIAGDFNGWASDENFRFERDENGIWKKIIKIKPGKYQYRLIVDGRWVEDPSNPKKIECPFGGYNSLLEV